MTRVRTSPAAAEPFGVLGSRRPRERRAQDDAVDDRATTTEPEYPRGYSGSRRRAGEEDPMHAFEATLPTDLATTEVAVRDALGALPAFAVDRLVIE
jgi:hypothetical protein